MAIDGTFHVSDCLPIRPYPLWTSEGIPGRYTDHVEFPFSCSRSPAAHNRHWSTATSESQSVMSRVTRNLLPLVNLHLPVCNESYGVQATAKELRYIMSNTKQTSNRRLINCDDPSSLEAQQRSCSVVLTASIFDQFFQSLKCPSTVILALTCLWLQLP